MLSEDLSELDMQTSQSSETTIALKNIHENVTNEYNVDDHFLPYEELMDLLPPTNSSIASTYSQTDGGIDMVSENLKRISKRDYIFSEKNEDTTILHVVWNEKI